MSEIPKNFIKFISEVVLVLVILITVFGGNGVLSNTASHISFLEPILLQNAMAKDITVASYLPGDFKVTLEAKDKHKIEFTKEQDIYLLNIIPAQESMIKTDYVKIEKIPLLTKCTITPETIEETGTIITIHKFIDNKGCEIVIS